MHLPHSEKESERDEELDKPHMAQCMQCLKLLGEITQESSHFHPTRRKNGMDIDFIESLTVHIASNKLQLKHMTFQIKRTSAVYL